MTTQNLYAAGYKDFVKQSCGPRLTRGRLDDDGLQFAQDTEMPEGRRDDRPLPSRAAGTSACPAMDETAGAFLYERQSGAPSPTPHRTPTYLHRLTLNSAHAPGDRKLGTSAFRAAASHRPALWRVARWEPNQKIQRRGLLKLDADALPVFGACRPGSLAPPSSEAEVEERGRVPVEVGAPASSDVLTQRVAGTSGFCRQVRSPESTFSSTFTQY